MALATTPYKEFFPGGPITAEDNIQVQKMIKEDIQAQINAAKEEMKKAMEEIDTVNKAHDAEKLGGKTVGELTDEILQKAMKLFPARTGYLKLFKRLKVGEEIVIKHELKACPLVDVYQLDYFQVVCAEDDNKYKAWVNFYLYHSSEKRIRLGTESIEIEPTDAHPYKVAFKEMLERYKVSYTETTSLGDLEIEFWKAFFAAPNDQFDDDQYCHSPWFERCCREERTVKSLRQKGDWDDIWFQARPRKTINYIYSAAEGGTAVPPTPAPTQIQVVHFDFDTLGITLLRDPTYPSDLWAANGALRDDFRHELKVMVLLKV